MDAGLHTLEKRTPPLPLRPAFSGLLQRNCACGSSAGLSGECEECGSQKLSLQRSTQTSNPEARSTAGVPPIVHKVLDSPGRTLDQNTRHFMESRFAHDFSRVRVHTDANAAESARAVKARAFTVGNDVVFDAGQYNPATTAGRQLLAHELTHTIQQGHVEGALRRTPTLGVTAATSEAEQEADAAAADVGSGLRPMIATQSLTAPAIQRDAFHTPSVSVRSPVFEEAVTQLTEFLPGRPLTRDEVALARSVFGASLDYSRLRLIPTDILEYRPVGNAMRIPKDFTITDEYMAQTFIHELTHIWQYQHAGTSYISISLGTQLAASLRRGHRNFAYEYQINPGQSFFDFTPEQQGLIVENYFVMLRDQTAIAADPRTLAEFDSNHFGANGFPSRLSATERQAEISRELPMHEPLLAQMRAALPRPEVDILTLRAAEVMETPGQELIPSPRGLEIAPIKPLLEIRFPGL